jgi:hypothetical protein
MAFPTALPYNTFQYMRVIALPEFQARARRLLSDEERAAFADYIGANPESGKVIPGLKGVRKVRWRESMKDLSDTATLGRSNQP